MRSKVVRLVGILFAAAGLVTAGSAPAQQAGQTMVLTVVNQNYSPAHPVPNVGINMTYLAGAKKVTAALIHTNPEGQVSLTITTEAQESGDLHIEIYDAPGLVIYQPAEGAVGAAQQQLTLKLLPKGSAALLEPAQIEAMLSRLSRLSLQNQQLQSQLSKQETAKPSIDQLLRDWAAANGFSYDEVNGKVQGWAQDVVAHRQEKSLTERAEAELAMGHYDNAAKLFAQSADTSDDELERQTQQLLEQQHAALRTSIQAHLQSAKSDQLGGHLADATAQVAKAQTLAAAEHQLIPGDAVFRDMWLWASVMLDATRMQEARADLTENSQTELNVALQDLNTLLPQVDKETEPAIWTYVQIFRGAALIYIASRSSDQEAAGLFAQLDAVLEAATGAIDKKSDPSDWLMAEEMKGLSLAYQASRVSGPQSIAWAKQSADTFRAALDMTNKANDAKEWSELQSNLGGTLAIEAMRARDSTSPGLMAQSVAAMQAAVEATNKGSDPVAWASAESGLANALDSQGLLMDPSQAAPIYAQAVSAYKAALEIRTQISNPGAWATIESALADALENQAAHAPPAEAKDLLDQDVAALQSVLGVYTQTGYPEMWARTEWDLGEALLLDGKRTGGAAGLDLLAKAAAANRSALEVYTATGDPERWARAEANLSEALAGEGFQTGGDQGLDDLKQAADADRAAMQVFSKDAAPQVWVILDENMGADLATLGRKSSGPQGADYTKQAADAWNAAMELDGKNPVLNENLSSIYHEDLMDFAKAYDLIAEAAQEDPSPSNKLNLAEASLTDSKFQECIDTLHSIDAAQINPAETPAMQTLLLACEWGAGDKAAAQTAAGFVAFKAGMAKSGWVTKGDRTYLASAPQFSANRAAWIKLFQSLEDGDGAGMADAAGTLAQAMEPAKP
jgi:hypothetical protein